MPYKGGVQLLPETQRRPTLTSYTSGNSYFWTGIVLLGIVIAASAILGGYKASLNDEIAALDGKLEATEKARDKEKEETLKDAQQQMRTTKGLLATKRYWSQALSLLEQLAQASVALTTLNAEATDGNITFTSSAPTYDAVARQLAAYVSGTGITDVLLSDITQGAAGLEFSGELRIDTKEVLRFEEPQQ